MVRGPPSSALSRLPRRVRSLWFDGLWRCDAFSVWHFPSGTAGTTSAFDLELVRRLISCSPCRELAVALILTPSSLAWLRVVGRGIHGVSSLTPSACRSNSDAAACRSRARVAAMLMKSLLATMFIPDMASTCLVGSEMVWWLVRSAYLCCIISALSRPV